jgi:ATP-dependent DNA ligase
VAHSIGVIQPHACQEEQEAAHTTPAFSANAEPPTFVTPMAAQVVKTLPEGDHWIYELKFDGYRALLLKDHHQVEIRSRNNRDLTRMYPRLVAAGLKLNADQAVVDSEIVALDAGSASFQALQHRGSHTGRQIVFSPRTAPRASHGQCSTLSPDRRGAAAISFRRP